MKRKSIAIAAIALVVAALIMAAPKPVAKADSGVSALFLNVGKADAAILMLGEKRYLMDTGSADSYDSLYRALQAYGIARLDGVILSHTDKDHVGGLKKLLKSDIEVDTLYSGSIHSGESDEEHKVNKSAEKYDKPLVWLSAGDELDIGDGCIMRVLGPLGRDAINENNNSLVIELVTPEGGMLFTGDMEHEEELELLRAGLIPKSDVLKVAHHGDDDATSDEFVRAVSPQWAVISTSTVEEPDTPDDIVTTALYSVNAGVAVTQDATLGILVTLEGGKASAQKLDYD